MVCGCGSWSQSMELDSELGLRRTNLVFWFSGFWILDFGFWILDLAYHTCSGVHVPVAEVRYDSK